MNPKVLRALLCICLCCAILFSSVARPARASSFASWVTNQISWDIGTSAILQGLGVFRDSASDYYDELMSNVKSYLESGGYIRDDLMTAYYFQSPLPQAASFYAFSKSAIEVVRQYLFDNGVVSYGVQLDSSAGLSMEEAFALCKQKKYYFVGYDKNGDLFVGYSSGNKPYWGDMYGTRAFLCSNGMSVFGACTEFKWSTKSYFYPESATVYESGVDDTTVTTSRPLVLGSILPPDTSLHVAYPQWLEHERTLEDGTTENVVQIGLGTTLEETESLSQEQIWNGQGTLQAPTQDSGQVSGSVLLPGWLQEGIENIRLGLQDILSSLLSLPQTLIEALANLFLPKQDYISAKVDALRGEFGFIDSVIATGEFIRDSVSGASGPPAIYVNLGNAPSGNYGSQRVLLTDFSWYAPYKSQVDTVLSAALWAFFGWKVFLNLPSIIGGESGYISDVAFYESGGYYGGRAREIRSGRGSRSKGKGGK